MERTGTSRSCPSRGQIEANAIARATNHVSLNRRPRGACDTPKCRLSARVATPKPPISRAHNARHTAPMASIESAIGVVKEMPDSAHNAGRRRSVISEPGLGADSVPASRLILRSLELDNGGPDRPGFALSYQLIPRSGSGPRGSGVGVDWLRPGRSIVRRSIRPKTASSMRRWSSRRSRSVSGWLSSQERRRSGSGPAREMTWPSIAQRHEPPGVPAAEGCIETTPLSFYGQVIS